MDSAREIRDRNLRFSSPAKEELQVLISALEDILESALNCFTAADAAGAQLIEPLEETIDRLIEEIRARHIARLQTGACTIQLGFVLNDLLANFERVGDHCSNIAVSVIEEKRGAMARHAYLHELAAREDFASNLQADLGKYRLPDKHI